MARAYTPVLKKLPKKPFKLVFDTNKLADWFDLPKPHDEDYYGDFNWYPSDSDLLDNDMLTVYYEYPDEEPRYAGQRMEGGVWLDANDKEIPEDVVDEIRNYMVWALESGTEKNAYESRVDALKETLEAFSYYEYDYATMERNAYHGTAEGILSVDVKYDKTTVVANPDIVHIINDCLNGAGEFYATDDLEGDSPQEFAETRFHWLPYYFKIYGVSKPKVHDSQEEFDNAYFADLVSDLEKTNGLSLLTKGARARWAGK